MSLETQEKHDILLMIKTTAKNLRVTLSRKHLKSQPNKSNQKSRIHVSLESMIGRMSCPSLLEPVVLNRKLSLVKSAYLTIVIKTFAKNDHN